MVLQALCTLSMSRVSLFDGNEVYSLPECMDRHEGDVTPFK